MSSEAIKNLREALFVSPENVPLRLYLAQILMTSANFSEAEKEYKLVLDYSKGNLEAKCGLCKACYNQGNYSVAEVLLEELCAMPSIAAEYHLLFAKVLLKDEQHAQAQEQYQQALTKDPALTDKELDAQFRSPAVQTQNSDDQEEQEQFSDKLSIERPTTKFEDIGGMTKVKEEIRLKIIHPITHSELYKAYGKKTGGGILLYGPPGCGKTHIARATAGEVNAKFISVGINDVLDMWMGNSEKNLHKIFELARKNTPCVLFFDEVDALGANRSDMKNSTGRHLINQFLAEMDGLDASNEGVLILAATNAPWHLDPAFRRPGRFDRIIFVQPPDEEARKQILDIHLKGKPLKDLDTTDVVSKTKEFSGADLKSLVDVVVEDKLTEAMKTGIPAPIVTKDFSSAVKRVVPSTKEWFTVARNYALYANESGLYNEILDYLKIKK